MMSTAFAIHTIYHHQFIEMHTVGSGNFHYSHSYSHSYPHLEMIWIAYFVVWTVCIAVSRVYLGFHYFQDILVGWLVGLVVGTLTELFAQYSWVTIGSRYTQNCGYIKWLFNCSRSWPLVVGINVFLFFWMYFHPYDRSSLLNFYLSEGIILLTYFAFSNFVKKLNFTFLPNCHLIYLRNIWLYSSSFRSFDWMHY